MSRYAQMFARLKQRGEGAFGAFLMLGDPDKETSARLLGTLVEAGADMIEVGIPYRINPRLVRSQYLGGMIWGVSLVLHEHTAFDRRTGRAMNANLAEYHVPVNADVPSIEAIIVDEHDPHVNALGVKGVGEIGITGTAGAIANAIRHATGVRVTQIPITLDKLIG